jgi:hypothetical protein
MIQKNYRQEIKYIISQIQFYRIKNQLKVYLTPDTHMREKGYRVRSLYFDSISDMDLDEALSGLKDKCKIRLRWYPDNSAGYQLEYKCKSGKDSLKRVLKLNEEQARRMVNGDYTFLLDFQDPLAKTLYTRMKLGVYRPRKTVEYIREAYGHSANNTRVTFDTQVISTDSIGSFFEKHKTGFPVMSFELGVLEVKYDGSILDNIERIVDRIGVQASANSKYVQSRLIKSL